MPLGHPLDPRLCMYECNVCIHVRGGSRNSGGGGFWAGILQRGGGLGVQGRRHFHILTSKKTTWGGGLNP